MKVIKRKTALLIVSVLCAFGLDAQNLYVNNDDGSTSTYSIGDVRRITIEEPNLVVLLFNGDSFSFPLEDLANYQYDETFLNVDNTVSIINNWQLNIYPNPVEEELNLDFTLKEPTDISYNITDLNGKVITEKNLGKLNSGEHIYSISTDDLSKGGYFVNVSKGGAIYSKKIIKN